eukprot:TRINITY_DN3918_c0_g1_i1.p1 TRINITY_DN3918_c0_g1~~TRINITY_DN3918_c0_g1_i1.p1  ORF type:complete len:517 (-),score=106.55 TRINITY_DN3918_c0_g1_i1:573-2123(-)
MKLPHKLFLLAIIATIATSSIIPGQGVHHWYNWQKDVYCAANGVYTPSNDVDLQNWMIEKYKIKAMIKVVGYGHAFGNMTTCISAQNTARESWILKLDNFLDISVDQHAKTATFGAGWGLDDLVTYLLQYNLTVSNTGTERVQNFVGAFTTGTHGTGTNRQIMAEKVLEMRVLMANGSFYTVDEDHYYGSRVSLGALGIITRVTIALKDIEYYRRTDKGLIIHDLPSFYKEIEIYAEKYPLFQLKDWEFTYNFETKTWDPSTTVRITYWEPVDPKEGNYAHNCSTIILCCGDCYPSLCYDIEPHAIAAPIQGHECGPQFFAEFEHMAPVNGTSNSTALLQEYVQHFNTIDMDLIHSIYDGYEDALPKVSLRNPELRYVKGDQIWMSEANTYNRYEDLFVIINVDLKLPFSNWEALDIYYDFLASFIPKYGQKFNSRPHWGKFSKFGYDYTTRVYPKVTEFLQLRQEVDPYCQFMNAFLLRALGLQEQCGSILDPNEVIYDFGNGELEEPTNAKDDL